MRVLYPASFLRVAEEHGLTLIADGECLRVRGSEKWRKNPSVVAYIKRNKALLLECLKAEREPLPDDDLTRLGAEVDAEIAAEEKKRQKYLVEVAV